MRSLLNRAAPPREIGIRLLLSGAVFWRYFVEF